MVLALEGGAGVWPQTDLTGSSGAPEVQLLATGLEHQQHLQWCFPIVFAPRHPFFLRPMPWFSFGGMCPTPLSPSTSSEWS